MPEPDITVEALEKKYQHYAFRYVSPHATTKHAIRKNPGSGVEKLSPNRAAQCGRSPVWFSPQGWMGTGSQEEYERNDALPVCKRCLVMIDLGSMTHQVKPSK